MKRYIDLAARALVLIGLGLLLGCDAAAPEEEIELNEITLVFEDNIREGFIFRTQSYTTRPLGAVPRDPLPDMLVVVYRTQENDAIEVAIGTDYEEPRFRPIGDFGGAEAATKAFLDVQEAPPFDLNYFNIAVVEEGQVWVVRTLDDRFAKIVILETDRIRIGNRYEGGVRLGWEYPIAKWSTP